MSHFYVDNLNKFIMFMLSLMIKIDGLNMKSINGVMDKEIIICWWFKYKVQDKFHSATLLLVVEVLSALPLLIYMHCTALTRLCRGISSGGLWRPALLYLGSTLVCLLFTHCQPKVSDTFKYLFIGLCADLGKFKAMLLDYVSGFLI